MDDAFAVRVLHGGAHLREQFESRVDRQLVAVTERDDRIALDQFHHEERAPARRGAGIEHAGDVRVVHQGQRLPLLLEARDHLPGVHAELDDLQRDAPNDRLLLLGHEHDAKAPFADLLQQLVGADPRAGALVVRRAGRRHAGAGGRPEELLAVGRGEHPEQPLPQFRIRTALPGQERTAFRGRQLEREVEELAQPWVLGIGHCGSGGSNRLAPADAATREACDRRPEDQGSGATDGCSPRLPAGNRSHRGHFT